MWTGEECFPVWSTHPLDIKNVIVLCCFKGFSATTNSCWDVEMLDSLGWTVPRIWSCYGSPQCCCCCLWKPSVLGRPGYPLTGHDHCAFLPCTSYRGPRTAGATVPCPAQQMVPCPDKKIKGMETTLRTQDNKGILRDQTLAFPLFGLFFPLSTSQSATMIISLIRNNNPQTFDQSGSPKNKTVNETILD